MSDPETSLPPSQNAPKRKLKPGTVIELTIDAAAFEGGSVGRYEGMAVFVDDAVPGDRLRAQVLRARRRHAEAKLIEVVEPGPGRVDPPCIHLPDCGGCSRQQMAYSEQLRWKRQHVVDAFERIGGLHDVPVLETLGCDRPFFYRNKMEFSFGDRRWVTDEEIASGDPLDREFALGLHASGRFDRVLDVRECLLQSERSNSIIATTRAFALEHGLRPYGARSHKGLLRHLIVRESEATGEVMVILVTSDEAEEVMEKYAAALRAAVPEITTIVQGVHRGKAQVSFTQELRTLYGSGTLTERIAGNNFVLSPFSFFQTNTGQAERLFQLALDAARLQPTDVAWDLYCGAGTITLAAARTAREVIGVEINAGSVEDARANAERNGVANARFIAGDLRAVLLGEEGRDLPSPDVVIIDPPRAGMHEDVTRALLERGPERISYVSCNPTTQARDCAILAERYGVEQVQPVDMFPQTYHVETVARLVRRR